MYNMDIVNKLRKKNLNIKKNSRKEVHMFIYTYGVILTYIYKYIIKGLKKCLLNKPIDSIKIKHV